MAQKFRASYSSRIAKNIVIRRLLDSGAVAFCIDSPILMPSGLVSLVSVDHHAAMADTAGWRDIVELMVSRVKENMIVPEVVAGAGCPGVMLAQAVALKLGLPVAVVHEEAASGETPLPGNTASIAGQVASPVLKGAPVRGRKVLLVTGHISCGCADSGAVRVLREAGAAADDILTLTDLGFSGTKKVFEELGVKVVETVSLADIVGAAEERGILGVEEAARLREWQQASVSYGKMA